MSFRGCVCRESETQRRWNKRGSRAMEYLLRNRGELIEGGGTDLEGKLKDGSDRNECSCGTKKQS